MNTVADKLMKLVQTKSDIRQALLDKGFNVPDTMPFSGYADLIRRFPCNAKDFPDIPGMIARWSAKGLTNEDMSTNPVWKDLTGNGHDLQMKNFGWAGMSGVNGYDQNFNRWGYGNLHNATETHTSNKIELNVIDAGNRTGNIYSTLFPVGHICDFNIKVTGLKDPCFILVSKGTTESIIKITNDGIYNIKATVDESWDQRRIYFIINNSGGSSFDGLVIEQLPLYPGFILGDGVDDFAVTEKELNFEDTYTVYTAFIPFQDDPARNMILCGKNETKDFSINYSGTHINFQPSKGVNLVPRINQFMLLVCKRNKDITTIINLFTGESKSLSSKEFIANPGLYYLWRNVYATFLGRAAIAGQTICNGYFSTDEDDEKVLNYYKQEYPWLFPDQVWTVTGKTNEDEDRATIANITGNGNDLILSNFGFAGNSGYGDYPISFPSSLSEGQPYGTLRFKTDGKYSNLIKTGVTDIRIKFNLRGMPEGGVLSIRGLDPTTVLPITEKSYTVDGLYEFVYNDSAKPVNIVFYNGTPLTGLFDFYVDIIPEYEGYLVTDGVDDEIQSSNFSMDKDFTVVGEWKMLKNSDTYELAGINKHDSFILYNYSYNNRINVYIHSGQGTPINTDSIKAFTSTGLIYIDDFNNIEEVIPRDKTDRGYTLFIGYDNNVFTKIAFKNFAIYSEVLSKEDCIKAYNYLQTLKS